MSNLTLLNLTTTTPAAVDRNYDLAKAALAIFKDKASYWSDFIGFLFGLNGIVNSLLTLATVSRNARFSEPCFLCYQAIAVWGLCLSANEAFGHYGYVIIDSAQRMQIYASYIQIWKGPVLTLFEYPSIAVICFLNVHRAAACLIPSTYPRMNRRLVCLLVPLVSFVVFAPMALPQLFTGYLAYNNVTGKYFKTDTDYGKYSTSYVWFNTSFRGYFRSVQAAAVFISSALAIVGMTRAAMSRRRLQRRTVSTQDQQTKNIRKLRGLRNNLQLCFLQLSQAVPLVVNRLLVVAQNAVALTDPDKYRTLDLGYQKVLIDAFTGLSLSFGHCCHFYMYVIFSRNFRRGFLMRFWPRGLKTNGNGTMAAGFSQGGGGGRGTNAVGATTTMAAMTTKSMFDSRKPSRY